MIKMYTQCGLLNIMSQTEFFNQVCEVRICQKTVNYPKLEMNGVSWGLNVNFHETFDIVNVEYNLENNIKFNKDNYLENCTDVDDIVMKIVEESTADEFYAVLVGDRFYFYAKPVMLKNGSNYEIICEKLYKTYSCNFHKVNIQGVKKIKATALAKKMYPDKPEEDGWLIVI